MIKTLKTKTAKGGWKQPVATSWNSKLTTKRAKANGASCAEDFCRQLERENAALRGALKEFRDIAFIGMVAPVPDVRPYYSLVKKHSALLKNELKKEAQP